MIRMLAISATHGVVQYAPDFIEDFLDSDPWNEEVILKRGQDLFDVACTVWPYPL